jgi:hypothetical protein
MQIKVFYEYIRGNDFPFRAIGWIDEAKFVGMSRNSYHGAKADLLAQFPVTGGHVDDVPEPEVVEV